MDLKDKKFDIPYSSIEELFGSQQQIYEVFSIYFLMKIISAMLYLIFFKRNLKTRSLKSLAYWIMLK